MFLSDYYLLYYFIIYYYYHCYNYYNYYYYYYYYYYYFIILLFYYDIVFWQASLRRLTSQSTCQTHVTRNHFSRLCGHEARDKQAISHLLTKQPPQLMQCQAELAQLCCIGAVIAGHTAGSGIDAVSPATCLQVAQETFGLSGPVDSLAFEHVTAQQRGGGGEGRTAQAARARIYKCVGKLEEAAVSLPLPPVVWRLPRSPWG
jgi:hypothetical protein